MPRGKSGRSGSRESVLQNVTKTRRSALFDVVYGKMMACLLVTIFGVY